MQLIQLKVKDESLLGALTQIERIALQGAQTVNRLQEFARLQEAKETGPTDLNRVIEDSLELTRHRWETLAQKRGVSYKIQRRLGDNVVVQGVHSQLVDAIVNLVRNAIDAMEQGGELIFETAVHGPVCRLSVADTGPGMTPEQIEKVFLPFYTTKGAEGTGLGMTVVNDIVQSLNGTIHLDSKPGKGTTVSIDLPVHGSAVAAAHAPGEQEEDDGLRLLVVDDDDIILEVVSEALDDAGHHVDSFKHGADAIEAIGRNRYDVVITDLGMPGVTGWDVARTAKMHEPQLPVVVISGWGAQFTDDQLTDSGVDAMLAKPFHLKMLRETIEQLARGEFSPTKIIAK
jgi:CheY-like chemotaxis protein/anti-sigma regulatory factor (Ser/Thr protein kinase)